MKAPRLVNRGGLSLACAGVVGMIVLASSVQAHEQDGIEEIVVRERSESAIGIASSASEGVVGAVQLSERPLLRPGELLETVPGLIVTQHSGSGKANQYFLRGFNLDHGTDFATWVDGMPVNMPTHAHGQGYSDLNFMIPELVHAVAFSKGPYKASEGDFSAAGAAHIGYFDRLDQPVVQLTLGTDDYYRGVFAGSAPLGSGEVLGAVEGSYNDGPWNNPEQFGKFNGVLRYSQGDHDDGFNVSIMGYEGDWDATDQVPLRAVRDGRISRFGALDPSDGGDSRRTSVSGEWRHGDERQSSEVSAYFIDYHLDLFSNFTFLLDNPVRGDQFEQRDDRQVYGARLHHDMMANVLGLDMKNTLGLETRFDDIQVGLFKSESRVRYATTRDDAVKQFSVSPYVENRTQWMPKFRSVAGLRGDFYHFDVASDDRRNSGSVGDGVASPKLSLIFGPWFDTEYYISLGYGFHSNDGRGATARIDPGDHVTPAQPVNSLVEARGAEVGLRTAIVPGLQSTIAVFLLDIDSELVFTGDAGTTEASRPSRRYGVEFANYYRPLPWLTFDADVSLSDARFTDRDAAGPRIPCAISTVVAAGVSIDDYRGVYGGLRLRYFGPRPLIEDDSVRSRSTLLLNGDIGYKIGRDWRIGVDVFNLLDARDHDIDYYYPSRISSSEPVGGVDDIHFHPVEPRQVRVSVTARF